MTIIWDDGVAFLLFFGALILSILVLMRVIVWIILKILDRLPGDDRTEQ